MTFLSDDLILLTRLQAAEVCQVSVAMIDRWSWEPEFPIIRRKHFVRIPKAALIEWTNERAKSRVDEALDDPPISRARRRPVKRT